MTPCPNYGTACHIDQPHFHFKTRDGERVMYLHAAPTSARQDGS